MYSSASGSSNCSRFASALCLLDAPLEELQHPLVRIRCELPSYRVVLIISGHNHKNDDGNHMCQQGLGACRLSQDIVTVNVA